MHYVYVLKSHKDEELYIGCTSNLKRRVEEHNAGKSFSTKLRRPFELVYYEAYKSSIDAYARESALKKRGNARMHLKNRILSSIQ
ncbi:excinuclease ABC subunit C [Candidatus Kaiserbacteria bacterium CG10_big_fil_rev_8_21_14_0_10_49_17]|uniref:Excinuclease ABC subunit C n=1 Tax=Candidatus Kaiserbacteria bacterium CG10_big_fil_rev_8_21_14_0_10_49_17 TaxID=1974609 RepID=A0A2M6WEL1_9BACT|nr:MAG: excinuclease ABC subunit C [Candidatus Kaiserbacteria bacterium CG10_big_fil_rev_8_21_14_0_10_49_17]